VKYALTKGITIMEGYETCNDTFYVPTDWTKYYHKNEWARTPEEALKLCEEKRQARVKALTRQLQKISNLVFKLP
jgi:hypothetical protein